MEEHNNFIEKKAAHIIAITLKGAVELLKL